MCCKNSEKGRNSIKIALPCWHVRNYLPDHAFLLHDFLAHLFACGLDPSLYIFILCQEVINEDSSDGADPDRIPTNLPDSWQVLLFNSQKVH